MGKIGLRTPDAHVRIFSYTDRGGSLGVNPADQGTDYDISSALVSISTSKQKSQPAGQFEIVLSPNKNWLALLSPGSWLTIHMSPRKMTADERKGSSRETLKMIGRIDSVRITTSPDQVTGAKRTFYTVSGRDWGQVFESFLYIDTAAAFSGDQPMGLALRLDYKQDSVQIVPERAQLSSSTQLMQFLIKIWGSSGLAGGFGLNDTTDSIPAAPLLNAERYLPFSHFNIPTSLASILNVSNTKLADNIKIVSGRLVNYDSYVDERECVGTINPHGILGSNILWQLLNAHSCGIVNELVSELRWVGNKPTPTLYKRIRPFALHNGPTGGSVIGGIELPPTPGKVTNTQKVRSLFFNLRKVEVPLEDVLQIDAGNNWRDALNFIELLPDYTWMQQTTPVGMQIIVKANAAVYSPAAFNREGLRPQLLSTTFMPPDEDGVPNPSALAEWLPVLKDWYFDTHKMLNGSMTFMGQPDFIGVGDNVLFDAKLIGDAPVVAAQIQAGATPGGSSYKVLAHVESISHRFTYQEGGSRNFVTSVNFVRGVITDSDGKHLTNPSAYGIETFAALTPVEVTGAPGTIGVLRGSNE